MTEPMYYIQYTNSYAGDYVLWWRHEGKGYTYNLDEAGLFPESMARAQERCRPECDKAWPREIVDAATKQVAVTIGALRASEEQEVPDANIIELLKYLPPMTLVQKEAQRRGFAYGNVAIDRPVTRDDIDAAAERMKADE